MEVTFQPKRVFFENEAVNYPLGRELVDHFRSVGIPVTSTGSHNRVTGIPGRTPQEAYFEGKQTLVIGVRKTLKFETCKPSAHYQLPLATGCPGKCEYCYLNTTLGKKPYLRIYVNIDEILAQAGQYIRERQPEITYFEGAATSDPLPTEDYTGALAQTIRFFGREELGRFRFVTKFTNVQKLLALEHRGHTRFRFSLNTQSVIERYERSAPSAGERLKAASSVAQAGYPLGFLVAPVLLYPGWQAEYRSLLQQLARELPEETKKDLTFEVVTHRFTGRAKSTIREVFPGTTLPMEEKERQFKFGQFGYGKYVYPRKEINEVKELFAQTLGEFLPQAKLEYIV